MAVRALTLARLAAAYLSAALAATAAVLLVDVVESLQGSRSTNMLGDLAVVHIYALYSLGFTLALGMVQWTTLRLLNRTSRVWYASMGTLLGLLTAGLGAEEGFAIGNALLPAFTAAGCAAALTFHRVYYGPRSSQGRSLRVVVHETKG